MDRPPNFPIYGYKWIALIPRIESGEGACAFVDKVNYPYSNEYRIFLNFISVDHKCI